MSCNTTEIKRGKQCCKAGNLSPGSFGITKNFTVLIGTFNGPMSLKTGSYWTPDDEVEVLPGGTQITITVG